MVPSGKEVHYTSPGNSLALCFSCNSCRQTFFGSVCFYKAREKKTELGSGDHCRQPNQVDLEMKAVSTTFFKPKMNLKNI